jgi:hypothetical protein
VPSIASLEELHRAVAGFTITDLGLVIEPAALVTARRSLDDSGFLLLGEVHGVRENPLIIRALMQALGLSGLALEWPEELAPMTSAFLAGEMLADHSLLWFGDGRITATGPASQRSGSDMAADGTTTTSPAGSAVSASPGASPECTT